MRACAEPIRVAAKPIRVVPLTGSAPFGKYRLDDFAGNSHVLEFLCIVDVCNLVFEQGTKRELRQAKLSSLDVEGSSRRCVGKGRLVLSTLYRHSALCPFVLWKVGGAADIRKLRESCTTRDLDVDSVVGRLVGKQICQADL